VNIPKLELSHYSSSQHPNPNRIFELDRSPIDQHPSNQICTDIPVSAPTASVRRIIRGVRIDPARTRDRDLTAMDIRDIDEPNNRSFSSAERAEALSCKFG
jgi:hypothetical protein